LNEDPNFAWKIIIEKGGEEVTPGEEGGPPPWGGGNAKERLGGKKKKEKEGGSIAGLKFVSTQTPHQQERRSSEKSQGRMVIHGKIPSVK